MQVSTKIIPWVAVTLRASSSTAFVVMPRGARHFTALPSSRLFPEELNIIYDSKCNICKLEIDLLRRRDERVNENARKLRFTDLEGETGEYRAEDPTNGGVTYAEGMKSMHGVWPDGAVRTGVPVFVEAYEQVGLGWLFAVTNVPGLKQLFDIGYSIFAQYRTNVTRGQTVDDLIAAYEEKKSVERAQTNADCEVCRNS